jgi:ketosteroid isomerase-like protein
VGEHAERIRAGFEAFNSRDFGVLTSLCHADVEWTPPPELPGSRTYRGPQGVREAIDDMLSIFPNLHAESVEFREDGDRVIGLYRWHGTGLETDATDGRFEVQAGFICDFEDDLLRVARFWASWDAALETADAEKVQSDSVRPSAGT